MQGCETLIGSYSPTAYKYATNLKVETLALMTKATEPNSKYKKDVDKLTIEVNKAHEYVKGVLRKWRLAVTYT